MLSEFGIAKHACSRWTALVVAAGLLSSCIDETVAPTPEPADNGPDGVRVLGFAELTFSDIGTPDFSSSLIMAPTMEALEKLRARRDRSGDPRDFVAQDLTFPDFSDGGGSGTIQLAQPQRNRFDHDGVRYLSTSFSVRNAQSDGSSYDTNRNNLTFLAVGTSSTINGTALSKLELASGAPAPAQLALAVKPTVRVELDGGTLTVPDPDVLQILRESEITGVATNAPPGVTNVFPYGFVVRRAGDNSTRTLPGPVPPGQFDGVVDFAFSFPLQGNAAAEPNTLSVLMLAVDDSETKITQGLQQQNQTDWSALQQRAASLGADSVTVLAGGDVPGAFGIRRLCSVRTAGPPASPTAHLVNFPDGAFQSFTPDPRAAGGSANHIPSSTSFQAMFSAPVSGVGPETFTVRGFQSGWAFLGQSYNGDGSTTISTPAADFAPGEMVEIALTSKLSCPRPNIARYRVQSGAASGSFGAPDSTQTEPIATHVALGDLRGTGTLDAVVFVTVDSLNLSVLLGNGDGSFQTPQLAPIGEILPNDFALADVDADGTLDIVTAGLGTLGEGHIGVSLGNGDGTFQTPVTFTAGGGPPSHLAIGDLNGDGFLDVATANTVTNDLSAVLGNGDGTFQPPLETIDFEGTALGLDLADIDGDNILDAVALVDLVANIVTGWAGNGDGTFSQQALVFLPADEGITPHTFGIGDMNDDGVPDVVTANSTTSDTSNVVVYHLPLGLDQVTASLDTDVTPRDVAIADVTGDGILDIITTNSTGIPATADQGNISVLVGAGFGNYQPAQTFPTGGNTTALATGSLRGNGILDVVTVGGAQVMVLLGQATP